MQSRSVRDTGSSTGTATAGMAKPLATGILFGVIVWLTMLVVMAFVLSAKNIPNAALHPLSTIAMAFGALTAGFAASRSVRSKGLVTGLLAGLVLFVLYLIAGLIFGGMSAGYLIVVRLFVLIIAATTGGVTGVNLRSSKKYR